MDRQALRQRRVLRGVAAAAVATLIAAVAHTLAGAGAPSPLLLAIVTLLAAPPAVMLVGSRPSVMRTGLAVLAAQVVFHAAFALRGGAASVEYIAAGPGHSGLHAVPLMVVHAGPAHAHTSMLEAMGADGGMSAAHLIAAVVTVLVFHRGERLLRAAGRGIRRLLALRTPSLPVVLDCFPPRTPFAPTPACRPAHFVVVQSRRGPPCAARARV